MNILKRTIFIVLIYSCNCWGQDSLSDKLQKAKQSEADNKFLNSLEAEMGIVATSEKTAIGDMLKKVTDKYVINVKNLGATGDGVTDDTSFIQQGIALASHPSRNGRLYIPGGTYRITRTLKLPKMQRNLIIYGDGGASKFSPLSDRFGQTTCLLWDGEKDGTLIYTDGVGGCVFKNLNLCGRLPNAKEEDKKAGILYQASSESGAGNMINSFDHVGFYYAKTGLRMGNAPQEKCNSDILFNFIVFHGLDTGFQVMTHQGVDYTFNFLFICDTGTVLDFVRGGNLLVNSAQITKCKLFLSIGSGGKMGGSYICNNVRLESTGGGRTMRHQLVKTNPNNSNCNIRFTGFNDCHWDWQKNKTDQKELPLCDVNGGAVVTFESSIFLSPIATVNGKDKYQGNLILKECTFYIDPMKYIKTGSNGFFKLENCFKPNGEPYKDYTNR